MSFTDHWIIRPNPAAGSILEGDGYRITVLTDRMLRLEYEPGNRFRNGATQTAINRAFPLPEFTVRDSGDRLCIETASLRLEYDKKPFSSEGLTAWLKGKMGNHGAVWHYGESERNLKGTARTLDRADGGTVRSFGGQGTDEPLEMGDGLMSLEGFAVLDDSRSMGMDETGRLTPADGVGIDLYLFAYGWSFKDALRDFYHLSGPIPPIPRYALGNWWSRYYCYTEKTYKALMERFASEHVPLSVAVIDMNWHITDIDPKYGSGWTGYTWNPEMFPDPKAMMDWLHERHLKVTLNEHPADGIRACEDLYPEMAAEMGIDPESGYPVDFDASSEQFLQAYEKVVLDSFERTGVDFWWIDWQQRGGSRIPGVDPLFVLNHTRWLYANRKGEIGMTFSRYGGPGSHRYPVGFSGDTCITWDSLAFQPYFTATAANIGYGWWSHDIGGHMLGIRDEELSVRWLQFGIFSPIMRLHSSMSEFLSKEPWTYSMESCSIMEHFLRLRHRLVPWLYGRMLQAAQEGSTILYPAYYDWNFDWDIPQMQRDEYVFGGQMLVVPIVTPMNRDTHLGSAMAWLPEGTWVDFFNGHRYAGGQRLRVFRPISEMPVFVRPGTIVPMDGAPAPENGCPLPEQICFRVFTGASGEHTLIEDNGARPGSPDYLRAETLCTISEGETLTLRIDPAKGAPEILPASRRMRLEIVGISNILPDEASCGYEAGYDADTRTLTLTLDAAAGDGAVLIWNTPSCPALDIPGMVHRLLQPIHMSNPVKDSMLQIAETVTRPERRLAAFMTFDLPDGLIDALTELEYIE